MVATLVKLKWRLTLNALTKNIWAIIGTVFGALYGIGAVSYTHLTLPTTPYV